MSLKRTWDLLLKENGGGGYFFEIITMLARKALKAGMAERGNKDSARNIYLHTKTQKAGLRNGVIEMPPRHLEPCSSPPTGSWIFTKSAKTQTEKELECLEKNHDPDQTKNKQTRKEILVTHPRPRK